MKIYILPCRIYDVILKKDLSLSTHTVFSVRFSLFSLFYMSFIKSNNQVLKFVGISEFEFESEDDLLHHFKASTTVTQSY